jgi:Ser/Thr protein kinase RdoA (MazF antagonist)
MNEVAHLNAGDREVRLFDGVSRFVGPVLAAIVARPLLAARIDEGLSQLVRRGHADELAGGERRLHEDLQDGQPATSQIVIAQRIGLVGVVQQKQVPQLGRGLGRLHQRAGRAPHGREVLIDELLQRRDERGKVNAQRHAGQVDAGDRRLLSLIEFHRARVVSRG